MKFNLHSIKFQLLLSFLSLSFVLAIVAILSFVLLQQSERSRNVKDEVYGLKDEIQTLIQYELSFLQIESNNKEFHSTGQHPFLRLHKSQTTEIEQHIEHVRELASVEEFELDSCFSLIENQLAVHLQTFDSLTYKVKERGYRDYGQEGLMRDFIHALEDNKKLPDAKILMLRRHEKDYLLRNDPMYIQKLDEVADGMLGSLMRDSLRNRDEIIVLSQYQEAFHNLVSLYIEIGNSEVPGMKGRFRKSVNNLETYTTLTMEQAEARYGVQVANFKNAFFVILGFFFLLSIILSFRLARFRSQPIRELATIISNASLDNPRTNLNFDFKKASQELRDLLAAFKKLLEKQYDQMEVIEEKNQKLENQNLELMKVNSELDHFVYSVSHDIRSPLASLMGLVNIAKHEQDINKIHECLEHQEKSLKKLDSFIRDVLALSRNSRQELRHEALDLNQIIEEVFEESRFSTDLDKINVEVDVDIHEVFYSDYRRIKVLFNNLISNAIRYSNKNGQEKWIKVAAKISEKEADISVSDNGIGIKPEHLTKIFDMFYRGTDDVPGSGLGLYIAKETLQKLGGEISVESTFGAGSTFHFRIPNAVKVAPKEVAL